MAKKTIIDAITKLYSKLGGNLSDVLGTRSNVNFMGTGKSSEPFLDMDLNIEALSALSQNKAVNELKSAVGFATADKLNDLQASKLLTNMMKMDEFYNPPAVTNITDMATGTKDLDAQGIMTLRNDRFKKGITEEYGIRPERVDEIMDTEFDEKLMDDVLGEKTKVLPDEEKSALMSRLDEIVAKKKAETNLGKGLNDLDELNFTGDAAAAKKAIDSSPATSTGGNSEIARESFKNIDEFIKNRKATTPFDEAVEYNARPEDVVQNLVDQKFGVGYFSNVGENTAKRGSAREFLVEALKKENPNQTTFADIVDGADVRFITEGGGGAAGDPIALVDKYFGPRIVEMLPSGASSEEIAIFTERVLTKVRDASGLRPGDPRFDRMTARFVEDFARGGLAKILEV